MCFDLQSLTTVKNGCMKMTPCLSPLKLREPELCFIKWPQFTWTLHRSLDSSLSLLFPGVRLKRSPCLRSVSMRLCSLCVELYVLYSALLSINPCVSSPQSTAHLLLIRPSVTGVLKTSTHSELDTRDTQLYNHVHTHTHTHWAQHYRDTQLYNHTHRTRHCRDTQLYDWLRQFWRNIQ